METFVTIKEAAQSLGVTTTTLRNWDRAGKLCPIRTLGGHRRYKISDIQRLTHNEQEKIIRDASAPDGSVASD